MRTAAGILAIAASGLACAGVEPPPIPACDATALRPPPEASCELGEEVADYKRDTVLTVWSYVGSAVPRLAIDFDARARVDRVCAEAGVRVGRKARTELERAVRALRAMPPAPRCLAGRSLDLRDEFANATSGWRRRRPEVEELCFSGQQLCTGWREPVCALLSDGSRRTYPDECAACRDPAVAGYDEGRCQGLY
jgi:hypothetical protein